MNTDSTYNQKNNNTNHSKQKNIILFFLSLVTFGCQVAIVFMLFFLPQFKGNFNTYITSCSNNLTSTKRLFYIESYNLILKVFSILASTIGTGFLIFFIKKIAQTDDDQQNEKDQKNNNTQRSKQAQQIQQLKRGQPTRNKQSHIGKASLQKKSIKNDFTLINNAKIIFLFLLFVIAVQTALFGKNFFVLVHNNSCMNSEGDNYSWKTLILLILASISGLTHFVSLILYYCINFNEPARLVFKSHPDQPKQAEIQMKKLQFLNSRLINLKIDQSALTHLSRQQEQPEGSYKPVLLKREKTQSQNQNLKENEQNIRQNKALQRRSSRSDFYIQNQHNKNNSADMFEFKMDQRQKNVRQLHIEKDQSEEKQHQKHNNYDENSKIVLNYDQSDKRNPINYYKFQNKSKYYTPKNNNNPNNLHNLNSAQRMIESQVDSKNQNYKSSLSKRKKIFQNSSEYSLKSAIRQKNSYL